MKPISPDTSKLCKKKKYAKNDTSYSSFWVYNTDKDILSDDFKDKIVCLDKDIFSEFNPCIAKNIISYWSNEKECILDPFAGRTRGFISGIMNRDYIGFEISENTYNYLTEVRDYSDFYRMPVFINDDSFNIDNYYDDIPEIDMIFTCPPYWCLEKYEDVEGELSNMKSYPDFLERLCLTLNKSVKKLKKDGYMCLVVGDFRKNKEYITFHSDLIQQLRNNKDIELHDVIVLQNIPFHVGAIYFGNMKKQKKVAKIHEYLLVYKKIN